MTRLKQKVMVVILLVAVILNTFGGPIFAQGEDPDHLIAIRDSISYLNEVEYLDSDYFYETVPKRIEAAFVFLKLTGLSEDALMYSSDDNFTDSDDVNEYAKNIMAYLKAHPELGWNGTGNNRFDPYTKMSAEGYYKVILNLMGYKQNIDFKWPDVLDFAKDKGLLVTNAGEPFVFKDLEEITLAGIMLKNDPTYSVDAKRAVSEVKYNEAVFLDIRSLTERNQGYFNGSEHIFVKNIESKLSSLDQNKLYMIYGDNEKETLYAVSFLRYEGFEAFTVDGGIPALLENGAQWTDKNEIETTLRGIAASGGPLVNGYISIYSTQGDLLYESIRPETTDNGSFEINVTGLPPDFRVKVENGLIYDEEYDAVLSADFANFDFENGKIYLNIPTTIVSSYLDKNPDMALSEAQSFVKDFLELPRWIDLGADLLSESEFFSYYTFHSNAEDINGYIDSLVQMMRTSYSFAPDQPMPQSAGGFIAKELAKGALNYAGGELMGWGLKKAGIDLEEEDHTAEQLQAIQEGLKRMENQLNDIKNSLTVIEKKLDYIISQLDAIRLGQLRTQYDIRITALDDIISSVTSLQGEISDFVTYPPSNPDFQRDSIVQSIRTDILQKYSSIHNNLVGSGGRTSLLKLWNDIIYNNRFITYRDYELIWTHFEYFRQIQESMLVLQVEYYHAIETSEGEYYNRIMTLIEEYESNIEAQLEFITDEIPDNIVLDTKHDLMISVNKKTIDGVDYLLPHEYLQVVDGKIVDITGTLNDNKFLGHDGWTYFMSVGAATTYFLNGWKVTIDGAKISGTQTVMEFLNENGWPFPRFFELSLGINSPGPAKGGFQQTKILSIEKESPPYKWQSIPGLSINEVSHWIIYRQMEKPEILKYYYLD